MHDETALRLSEQEVALYRELGAVYERILVLARAGRYAEAAGEAGRSRSVFERLAPVAAAAGAARAAVEGAGGVPQPVQALRDAAAGVLREVLRRRDLASAALAEGARETRAALARLGRVRTALAGYGGGPRTAPRFESRRA